MRRSIRWATGWRPTSPRADEQDRAQVERLAAAGRDATGESVGLAYVDRGYTGQGPTAVAEAHGIRLGLVKHPEVKRGFVLLRRRWVVEPSFGWTARFRRLARDYERLAATLVGFHFVAFACLMLKQLPPLPAEVHYTL